jgi:hypothetical protein
MELDLEKGEGAQRWNDHSMKLKIIEIGIARVPRNVSKRKTAKRRRRRRPPNTNVTRSSVLKTIMK